MAVPLPILERGETQIIALSSNDSAVQAGGVPGNFRITLAETLHFPGGGEEWVVTLADATFEHPGSLTSVYLSTSINQQRVDGSQLTQVLARFPPASTPGPYHFSVTTTLPQWLPIIRENVSEIEVQLADDSGNLIPSLSDTTVTLMIRKIR